MKKSTLLKGLFTCLMLFGSVLFPLKASAAVPVAPSNLVAVAGDATSIGLSWHDNSSNEEGFRVYCRAEGETEFVSIGQTRAGFTNYRSGGLSPGTKYYYRIKAFNEDGESYFSNTESDTTQRAMIHLTAPAGGELWQTGETHNITWTSNGEGFQANLCYKIGTTWYTINTVPNTNSYSWTIPSIGFTRATIVVRLLLNGEVVAYDQSGELSFQPAVTIGPVRAYTFPDAPENLNASAETSDRIHLNWQCDPRRDGIEIERKSGTSSFVKIGETEYGANQWGDTGINAGTTYTYRVRAYNKTESDGRIYSIYSNEATAATNALKGAEPSGEPKAGQIILRFYVDSTEYYLQGKQDSSGKAQTMDAAPILTGGRTLLPISYIAGPLGADVEWDAALDQVTVKLGSQTIVMWINNGTARVNGVETTIDPANPNVIPITVPPGRTMLPLSFIAANLGCDVQWNAATSEVTVTYPKAS